jgi:hypothetical protein
MALLRVGFYIAADICKSVFLDGVYHTKKSFLESLLVEERMSGQGLPPPSSQTVFQMML